MGFSLSDPVVQSYMFYSGVLGLKVLALGALTGIKRSQDKAYANPEDAKSFKVQMKTSENVERVRRAHLNDLENIPVFWIIGGLYATTNPEAAWAVMLYRAVTAGRILHTLVYAVTPLPQPTRAIAYSVPYFITIYMGIKVVMHYSGAL